MNHGPPGGRPSTSPRRAAGPTWEAWILDGDLGRSDSALGIRLRAADTVIVLNFGFLRCAWRTLLRSRERADYWRWVVTYRRQNLPGILQAIHRDAPQAGVHVLRHPRMATRLLAQIEHAAGSAAPGGNGG